MNTRSYSFLLSLLLHGLIISLMVMEFSWGREEFQKTPPALLMIDLTKVQIGDKTNLPPQIKKKAEQPKKAVHSTPKPKEKQDLTPKVSKAPTPKPTLVKPKETPVQKNAVQIKETKKVSPKKPAQKPKGTPKKATPSPKRADKPTPKPTSPKPTNNLKSLLASVDKVRKPITPSPIQTQPAEEPVDQQVTEGIQGGTGGSLTQILSISEQDLIANKLRGCWNVDAGAAGVDEMIIEIRADITRDGRVKLAKILNNNNHPSFRSVAESARRAVYICDNLGEESPFKILAEKRPESYNDWKEIYIRFDPATGGVF